MVEEQSISVLVAALNEERHLEKSVKTVIESLKRNFKEYEIIIFNDGSTDGTGEIAEKICLVNQNIRVVHHKEPKCVGGIFKEGIKLAKMNYLMLVVGKKRTSAKELDKIFALKGKCDIVIPYSINLRDRTFIRRNIARAFTKILNTLFGLNLNYYNHFVLYKRAIVKPLNIRTNSYAFQAEALVKLIKSGHSYLEVGQNDLFQTGNKTRAFKLRNIFGVLFFFFRLIFDIYLSGQMPQPKRATAPRPGGRNHKELPLQ